GPAAQPQVAGQTLLHGANQPRLSPLAAPAAGRRALPRGAGRARPHHGPLPQRPAASGAHRRLRIGSRKDAMSTKDDSFALSASLRETPPRIMTREAQSGGTTHAFSVAGDGHVVAALSALSGRTDVPRPVRDE